MKPDVVALAKLAGLNAREAALLWGGLKLLLTGQMSRRGPEPGYGIGYRLTLQYRALTLLQWLSGDRLRYGEAEARLMERALARLKAQTQGSEETLPVPEVSPDIDPAAFRERFVRDPHPVVIRGLARDCDAVGKWSRDFFRERYGDTELYMNKIVYGDRIGIEEWLGKLTEVTDNEGVYVDNSKVLFTRYPELVDDIAPAPGWGRFLGRSLYLMPQLFLGYTPGAPFHCANHWNFFVMAQGSKQWTFVSPEHSLQLGALLNPSGIYADACVTGKGGTWRDSHELFSRYCPKYRTVLEQGDVLLNPPWWWHEIHNLTPFTIGVATRWIVMDYARTNSLFDFVQLISPSVWRVYYHGMATGETGEGDARQDDILRKILGNRQTNAVYRGNYARRCADPAAPGAPDAEP